MSDRDLLIDFSEHPWSYDDARDAGLVRAWGLRAVDGDTVDLVADPGFRLRPQIRVRLRGVDTPEIYGVTKGSDEYEAGMKAKRRVADLVEGRPVLVHSGEDTGKYGRWISAVYVEITEDSPGRDLSSLLHDEGLDVNGAAP